MALQKQALQINFSKGLDTKTDPLQVAPNSFLSLQNTVFDKGGRLTKRNGFKQLTSLATTPFMATASTPSYAVTTYGGNLTAVGPNLYSLSQSNGQWSNRGALTPCQLSTTSLLKNNTNQSYVDTAVAPNGLVCVSYTDNVPVNGSNVATYKYLVSDSATGQNVITPVTLTAGAGTVEGPARVFLLGNYFILVYSALISAVHNLVYIAVSVNNPSVATSYVSLTTNYTPSSHLAFDGVIANNQLYLVWGGNDIGNAVRMTTLNLQLTQGSTKVFGGQQGNVFAICADTSNNSPFIYVAYNNTGTNNAYALVVDYALQTVTAPTQFSSSNAIVNITMTALNRVATIICEFSGSYSYDNTIPTNNIQYITCTQSGTLGNFTTVRRSVGLASKAAIVGGVTYLLAAYESPYQSTYFLLDLSGNIVSKLAYENAGGYLPGGLPNTSVGQIQAANGTLLSTVKIPYLLTDLIQAVNGTSGGATGTFVSGVYTQTGLSMATFTLGAVPITTSEIGNDLHISGGILWMYDGYQPVEHGQFLYPDSVEATWSTSGGNIHAQPDGSTNTNAYFYQVTYEWSDNQGNIFRSAPSIPVAVTTTGSGTSGSITLNIPTLRLTYKINNPVKIVIYRWSAGQQTYYQTTSVTVPILNSVTTDSIQYVDTHADSAIIGNNIIYTNGGVVENIASPAATVTALFDTRLWVLDSEDQNLLWFSKEVIEATPVEMSDLFTVYVSPTISAQGSTGPITALSSMDDKLVIFKRDAIYYVAGSGPDNTGIKNEYTQPTFITATVGCTNQQSIVFMPGGLMFQSDKGIWLLGRDLNTSYIGAPVEAYTTGATVTSAVNVPGTNQVRLTLSTGITLMYDYFYGQWGTFTNTAAVSSTLYQNLHTYITSTGLVFQESPGVYLDGSQPVLMQFQTGWFNLAGLQGYQRVYFLYILGKFITPHKLNVSLSYDYNESPWQTVLITPDNYSPAWGGDASWGSGQSWGGVNTFDSSSNEQWRIFPDIQRCEAFQIALQEIYDPSYGVTAGAGFTMSGVSVIVGAKKGYPTLAPGRSAG